MTLVNGLQSKRSKTKRSPKRLNDLHQKENAKVNNKSTPPPPLKVGDTVWYCAEDGLVKDKLQPIWQGPGKVLEKRGQHSYVVQIGSGKIGVKEAHRDQLRPHVDDVLANNLFPSTILQVRPPP